MNYRKAITYFSAVLILLLLTAFTCSASAHNTAELISNEQGRLIGISHRGDTLCYPANSLEAMRSAAEKGADAVSVSVTKTSDGEYVLCEDITPGNFCSTDKKSVAQMSLEELQSLRLYDSFGHQSSCTVVTLSQALDEIGEDIYLILDVKPQDMDGVYALLKKADMLGTTSLRVQLSASRIAQWLTDKDEATQVIGIYKGNIIWNSIGHINKLSREGMELVQYNTKNYFNVCYGSIVSDNFSAEGKARAIAAAYDADLCGKRSDSESGWNELVKTGFTAIETNNIEALMCYIERTLQEYERLEQLVKRAEKLDSSVYSSVSRNNLTAATENARLLLQGRVSSHEELVSAYSLLAFSINEKRVSDGHEDTRGALNITAGKVIAAVLVGAALLAGQIYVHKMKKKVKK